MKNIPGKFLLASAMWLSWLALTWLIIFEVVEKNPFNSVLWGLFLFFSLGFGALAYYRN